MILRQWGLIPLGRTFGRSGNAVPNLALEVLVLQTCIVCHCDIANGLRQLGAVLAADKLITPAIHQITQGLK